MASTPTSRLKKSKKGKKKKQEPYRPLAPSFETPKQFNKAVNQRAKTQYQPLIQETKRLTKEEERKSAGREKDIKGWTNYYGDTLNDAFDDTRSAINNLMVASNASDQAGADTLSAALRAQESAADQRAKSLGVGDVPMGVGEAENAGSEAFAQAGRGGLAQVLSTLAASNAARQTLAPVLHSDMMRREGARSNATLKDLTKQRKDILGRVPSFREEARREISEEERNKQNLRFQQRLAKQEFKLKKKQVKQADNQFYAQLGFEREKFEHAKEIDIESLAQQQRQLDLQAQELADSAKGKEAELLAQRFNKGVEALTGYLTPSEREEKKGKNIFDSRDPAEIYNILRRRHKLPHKQAMTLIKSVDDRRWRQFNPKKTQAVGEGDTRAEAGA